MIVSLNEVQSMASKAASGAGRPWGVAQEAGRAVAALEAMRLPGAASMLTLLNATDGMVCDDLRPASTSGTEWQGRSGLCPVLAGAYIADLGELSAKTTLVKLHVPLLLVPFVGSSQIVGDTNAEFCERIEVLPGASPAFGGGAGEPGPVDIGDEIWEGLSAFAHRTYVPATEASRLKGAGAGLTDND